MNLALLAWFLRYAWDLPWAGPLIEDSGRPLGGDFAVFWSVATLTADGHLLELFDPAAFQRLAGALFDGYFPEYSWAHPPQMLFMVVPLAALPYLAALAAWSLLTLAAYLVATRQPALLCAPSTFMNLNIGQAGFLLGALYVGALRLLDRRPILAGGCFGLLAVKPHLGILVPVALVALRAWPTIAVAALTVAALAASSGLVFGWETWRLWFVEAIPYQTAFLQERLGGRITPSAFAGARILGLPAGVAWLVQAPFTLAGVAATWWAFSGLRRSTVTATTAGAVLLLSTAIATPYLFHYDLTLVSPVALAALAAWRERATRLRDLAELAIWLGVWMLPFLLLPLNARGLPVASLVLAAALGFVVCQARGTTDVNDRPDPFARTAGGG